MAEGDERIRTSSPRSASGTNGTRRAGLVSTDPRDDTASTSRASKRPVSTGRARAAKQAAGSSEVLSRLDELPAVIEGPATSRFAEPVRVPTPSPVLPPPAGEAALSPAVSPHRGRNRPPSGTSRRRGSTSELPDDDGPSVASPDDDGPSVASPDDDGPSTELLLTVPGEPTAGTVEDRSGEAEIEAEIEQESAADDGLARLGRFGGIVLPVETRPASAPRVLLPTGRLPRVGEPGRGRISDLPLQGIEPVERSGTPGVIVVPELDPSGEIVRDGPVTEHRTLRDRLEPIFVRRPRPRVRRVTRVLRHIDTWSVFKVALVFNLVVYVVCLTAGVLLWNVAYTTGTIDNVEQFFEQFGWEHFEFHGGEIYHHAWIAGLFAIIGLTGFAVLLATLFNLITDLVGGVRLSVLEEEVVERAPRRRSTSVARERRPRRAAPADGDDHDPASRPVNRATGEVPRIDAP